jgi:hypothetical protein
LSSIEARAARLQGRVGELAHSSLAAHIPP